MNENLRHFEMSIMKNNKKDSILKIYIELIFYSIKN